MDNDKVTSTSTDATGTLLKRKGNKSIEGAKELLSTFFDDDFKTLTSRTYFRQENGVYDRIVGSKFGADGNVELFEMKLKDLDATLIRSIVGKIGGKRTPTKESNIEVIKALLSGNPAFEHLEKTFDKKDEEEDDDAVDGKEKARIVMRFIGVIFSDGFRDAFSKINDKKDRTDLETLGDFYTDVANVVVDNTSEAHNNVLPPEGSKYDDFYKTYLSENKFKVTDDIYPSTAIGPEAVKYVTADRLKKMLAHLLKVRKVIKQNMEKSGTNNPDPMEFAAVAIRTAKVPLYITKLASFYFHVLCDAHDAIASCIQRDLHSALKCDTTQGMKKQDPYKKPPKKAKTANKSDDVSRRISGSLESSDNVSLKISIGNRATNTEITIAMMQETRQKNNDNQTRIVMKLCEDDIDDDMKQDLRGLLNRYKKEAKELDDDIERLKKTAASLQEREQKIVPVPVAYSKESNKKKIVCIDDDEDSICTIEDDDEFDDENMHVKPKAK